MKVLACEANEDTDKRKDGLCGKTVAQFLIVMLHLYGAHG